MPSYPIARRFEHEAHEMLRQAEDDGETVYGAKPWYCSARFIEDGAKVAFIGANPGGGPQSERNDNRLGILTLPYEDPNYNAWLCDRHWDRGRLQPRVIEAFKVLFGTQGQRTLREAACFNVVPLRTKSVKDLCPSTWNRGVAWAGDVLEHINPEIIVCLGNGSTPSSARSAWNMFNDHRFGIEGLKECEVVSKLLLKRGRIARGKLAGARVIGLPHLSRPWGVERLRDAHRQMGGWDDFLEG